MAKLREKTKTAWSKSKLPNWIKSKISYIILWKKRERNWKSEIKDVATMAEPGAAVLLKKAVDRETQGTDKRDGRLIQREGKFLWRADREDELVFSVAIEESRIDRVEKGLRCIKDSLLRQTQI